MVFLCYIVMVRKHASCALFDSTAAQQVMTQPRLDGNATIKSLAAMQQPSTVKVSATPVRADVNSSEAAESILLMY